MSSLIPESIYELIDYGHLEDAKRFFNSEDYSHLGDFEKSALYLFYISMQDMPDIMTVFIDAITTLRRRNAKYTGKNDSFLWNFEKQSEILDVSREQAILNLIAVKFARLLASSDSKEDPLDDSAVDLLNYAALLALSIRKNKGDI